LLLVVTSEQSRIAELDVMVATLAAQNERLLADNQALATRVAELERELGRHSGNSGRPPSSDTLTAKAKQAEERLSRAERRRRARAKAKKLLEGDDAPKRKPGKQPGDEGKHLKMSERPDHVIEHRPESCGGCGVDLGDAPVTGSERRQVFDLPRRRLEVTEHQAQKRRCSCGRTTKAAFPVPARASACYGPGVRALAVYLLARQHLPVARAAELLSDALGAPVSTGWLAGLGIEAAEGLEGFLAELRRQLIAEDVLHADETGARISGARHWFHVACTGWLTLLDCHPRRGTAAFDDMAVLGVFEGTLVSDGWKPYWSYPALDHALCCAHLLRDLASVAEVASQAPWADAMAELLVEAKRAVDTALANDADGLTKAQLRRFRTRYTRIINQGLAANPVLRVSAGCGFKEGPVAAADGEEYPEPVVGELPKSRPDALDLLDDGVEALGGAVGGAGAVPGQDLAAPPLEGAGHASHLLGPGVPAVLDEAVDPAAGQLGLAVEGE
jgi:transposase